jgi:hypothetical protein
MDSEGLVRTWTFFPIQRYLPPIKPIYIPSAQTVVLSLDSGAGPRRRSRDYLLLITLQSQALAQKIKLHFGDPGYEFQ